MSNERRFAAESRKAAFPGQWSRCNLHDQKQKIRSAALPERLKNSFGVKCISKLHKQLNWLRKDSGGGGVGRISAIQSFSSGA